MSTGTARAGIVAALLGATAYGVNIPAAKIAADLGVGGPAVILIRSGLFLIVIVLAMLISGWRPYAKASERQDLLLLGCFSAATALGYLSSLSFLPVSVAVVVFYTFPLWIILLTILRGAPGAARRLLPFAMAFAGIVLVLGGGAERLDPRGLTLALGASIACAAMFLVAPRITSAPLTTLVWTQPPNVIAGALGLLLFGGVPLPSTLALAAIPLFFASVGYYLGFALQVLAAQKISPAAAGLLFLFEPVVAIICSVLLLGEPMGVQKVGGICLVIAGLALDVVLERARRDPQLARSEA
jgi:drug/metabolite transporter (DMT)-like permease